MVRDSAVSASLDDEPGESQRSFGLEVEFVFDDGLPGAERARRIQRIIDDLVRFGLTGQARIDPYHSGHARGYTSRRSGWRVELDSTVHGEVVSPILPYEADAAERQRVWRDIALVLGVIRRHGGGNDRRAGGHVHVGLGDYQRDVAALRRLIGLFRANQDSLYRLATTPGETFTRLAHAEPLPEPEQDEDLGWTDLDESRTSALNLSPLYGDYEAGKPAGSDHVEARVFDGFLARQLGLGGVRARVEVIRALADAALRPSGPAEILPSDLGDSFLNEDPDLVAGAAALTRLLGLFSADADQARVRLRRLWELTRWQPDQHWPPSTGTFYWPAEDLPEEQLHGLSQVAARHPGRPVFMYVDQTLRVELLQMALDRYGEAELGVIVAIVGGPGADSLDALPAAFGVLLVRPAAADGHWPVPRLDEQNGITGWVSDTGWVLVGRGASGASIRAELGSFFGPEQLEQVLRTGLLTPYQAGRLSGHRIMPPSAYDQPGAAAALARLAGRPQDGPGGLREAIAQALFSDLYGPGSRYAAFLPAGQGRNRTIRLIRAGQSPDDRRILPLTLTIAADLLGRPIIMIGPDAASSAEYGQDRLGVPIDLIPLALGRGFSQYLVAAPVQVPAADVRQAPGAPGRARIQAATVQARPDGGTAARGVATPSGFYLPGGPALDGAAAADELAAATWFPPVTGAQVWHLHLDAGTGRILAGDQVLTPDEFYDQVMAARQRPPGTVLVIVGCGAAGTAPGAAASAAQVLARRSGSPVLAADTDAWTTPDGRVLAAPAAVDAAGRPVLGSTEGNWVLVPPDGQPSTGLGPDLLAILRRGTLPAGLLNGIQPPQLTYREDRPRPVRNVRWAMGVEIERRNVRLFVTGGQHLPAKTVLLRSRDGLVKVVVDAKSVWLGQDGVLYESPEAMAAVGVAADPQALNGGKFKIRVPEIVTVPWAVRAEPGRPDLDAVLARIRDVDQRWSQAPATRTALADDGRSLADLFPASHYEFTPESQHVRVVRLEGVFAGAPLMVQLSVGVPLGGGVHAALEEFYRGMDPGTSQAAALRAALGFGWDVAGDYVDSAAGAALSPDGAGALAPGWDVAEALTVAEVMALAFVQLRAVLTAQVPPEPIMKNRMAVVARHSLYEIWAELGPRLQAFFRDQRDVIGESFEAAFLGLVPDFAQQYNAMHGRSAGAPVDLRAVEFSDEYTGAFLGTVGQLFDELLRPDPGGERIKQEVFDVARADSGGPDWSRGRGPGAPLPLVVLEMRSFARSKYSRDERPGMSSMIDDQMMMDRIGRMTSMAGRGEAAAESARRLPATPEGQLVLAWLRQTAAAEEGAVRDGVALNLRQAVAAYLARFPGERAVLGVTLGPFTEWLRLSDLVWAGRDEIGCSALAYVLGRAGHQAAEQEVAAVAGLARMLGMPVRGEEQWLADLARVTGVLSLPPQARVSGSRTAGAPRAAVPPEVRLFRLLVLAALVFDDGSASRRALVNLRRLVDLVGVAGGEGAAEVVLADLQAEYRLRYGLGAGAPVSMWQLRELVALTGQVSARLPGSIPVTRTDLTARVGQVLRAGQSTLRLGDWLGVLRGRVLGYFDQLGAPTPDTAVIEQVTAVLAEALDLAGDAPGDDRGVLEWDALVGSGLRWLLRPGSDRSYAGELPGIDPAGLAEGSQFTVGGLIRAHGSEGPVAAGGVVYVIVSPQGRDVSGLVGGGSDLVMFDRGQRFVVVSITRGADGRLEIELRHPGHHASGAGAPPAATTSAGTTTSPEVGTTSALGPALRLRGGADETFASGQPGTPTVDHPELAQDRGAEVRALAAVVFGGGEASSAQMKNLRLLMGAVRESGTGLGEVTAGELGALFRRLHELLSPEGRLSWAGVAERRQKLAGAEGGGGALGLCVAVASGFLGLVYPRLGAGRGDDAVGLGGVAGVRERLVPGGVWARVGSWGALERAVAGVDGGASAVVLVSFAGARQGHALVLHRTAEGLRWADPDPAGGVSVRRPVVVGRAVAGWAVVVRGDGRVVEPGGWAAAESAGGVGMLADPPLRHDFGAMGVEIERHNVRLFLPGGELVPEKTVLLRSRDGLVSVVVDNGDVWLGMDGLLYERSEAMEAAGVVGDPRAGADGHFRTSVPEIVTVPWAVGAEPARPGAGALLDRIRDVDQRWEQAPATGTDIPGPAGAWPSCSRPPTTRSRQNSGTCRRFGLRACVPARRCWCNCRWGCRLAAECWPYWRTSSAAWTPACIRRSYSRRRSGSGGRPPAATCAPRLAARRRRIRPGRSRQAGTRPRRSPSLRSWRWLLCSYTRSWTLRPDPGQS